jgi:protein-S-isoprenylcysteine O-methyltransferase Ste14
VDQPYAWIPAIGEILTILAKHNLLPTSVQGMLPRSLFGSAGYSRISNSFLLGAALTVLGAQLRFATYRTLGKHFTYRLSLQPNHTLVTSGPYSVVRHPSYTGVVLIFLGANVAYASSTTSWLRGCVWPWYAREASTAARVAVASMALSIVGMETLITLSCVNRVNEEDNMLRSQFKQGWKVWAERVPYKLVPGVY